MKSFLNFIETKMDKTDFSRPWERLMKYSEEGKYQKIFRSINFYSTCLIVIMMIVVFNYVKQSTTLIQKGLENNIVYIHDTVLIQPPQIFYCWNCKKELAGISAENPITCCEFEYKLQHGELVAKKIK